MIEKLVPELMPLKGKLKIIILLVDMLLNWVYSSISRSNNVFSKFSNKNNMESKSKNTMCLTNKIVVPHKFKPLLDDVYNNIIIEVDKMLKNRNLWSSKFYKSIPCVVSKSLISKYQRNLKCKQISRLVIPICGDKGKQVKIVESGIRIPVLFKKEVLEVELPKNIAGNIRQVEFFKRESIWYMSYSYKELYLLMFPGYLLWNFNL